MARLFLKSIAATVLLSLLTAAGAFAQNANELAGVIDVRGMSFFNPDKVLTGQMHFDQIPELSYINANGTQEVNREMGDVLNFMKYNGIALGLGVNSNRDSAFDLYAPFVDILLDEPAALMGKTEESRIGKMHYLTHDTIHLFAGIPGPRRAELQNREEAHRRLTQLMMRKESIATAWTALNHVRWFWKWRHDHYQGQSAQFDKLNTGLNSALGMPRQDYIDMVDLFLQGKPGEQMRVMQRSANWETYEKATAAGVPMLFHDFRPKIGTTANRLLMKYGLPVMVPLIQYYHKKFGYKNLIQFAGVQADFYLSDWYVEWAERFKVGESIEEMERNVERKIQDLKDNKMFSDVPQAKQGVFEAMFIRNAVTHYGRKLIELQYLEREREARGQPLMTEQERQEIDRLLKNAVELNETILAAREQNRAISQGEITQFKGEIQNLFKSAERSLPAARIIPTVDRLAFFDYSNFWRDPFAPVVKRPEFLTKFLSARGIWKEALRQRKHRAFRERLRLPIKEVDRSRDPRWVAELEAQLAAEYNENRRASQEQRPEAQAKDYLSRLDVFRTSLRTQIHDVFIPQVQEYENLDRLSQQRLVQTALDFHRTLDDLLVRYEAFYRQRYVEYSRDQTVKEQTILLEEQLKASVETSMYSLIEILEALERNGRSMAKVVNKGIERIQRLTNDLETNTTIKESLSQTMLKVAPMRKGRVRSVCSMITKICTNSNISDIIRDVIVRRFSRQAEEAKFVFRDASGRVLPGIEALPPNAAIVLAMNHDHAPLDGYHAQKLARLLGIQESYVLTNREVWPHLKLLEALGIKHKDPRILFTQDENLKERVMSLLNDHRGKRVALTIFPEGQLPFWGAQFPLHANFGAFNYAREAAHRMAGVRPVFYVEAHSNFLRSLTAPVDVPMEIEVRVPEVVPTSAVGKRDAWVESRRAQFEQRANDPSRRGNMTDLVSRQQIPNGKIYVADEVRPYKKVGDFFREKVEANAEAAARKQTPKPAAAAKRDDHRKLKCVDNF